MKGFDMLRVAPVTTGNTFVFTTYMRCITVVKFCVFENPCCFLRDHISVSCNGIAY